jgi:HlyD family secretion protein
MKLLEFIPIQSLRLYLQSLMLTALAVAGCTSNRISQDSGYDPSTAKPTKLDVSAQGRLLPLAGIVQIGSLPGDRIETIKVAVGDRVNENDVLVVMRSEKLRKGELEAAQVKLQEARKAIEAKNEEALLSVSTAKNRHLQAETAHRQALEQLKLVQKQADMSPNSQRSVMKRQLDALVAIRNDPLTRTMVGSLELDARRAEFTKLDTTLESSLLTAKQAVETTKFAVQIAFDSMKTAEKLVALVEATSPIESLEKQIELLGTQFEQSRVVAPSAGKILAVLSEAGELMSGLPILEMADVTRMVCVAEVHESDVASLSVGDVARVSSSGLGGSIQGKVLRIDSMVGVPQMRSPNPLARTDYRAIPVVIEIDPEFTELAAERVQLQVDVRISHESQ